jgi:hypothetical protein
LDQRVQKDFQVKREREVCKGHLEDQDCLVNRELLDYLVKKEFKVNLV